MTFQSAVDDKNRKHQQLLLAASESQAEDPDVSFVRNNKHLIRTVQQLKPLIENALKSTHTGQNASSESTMNTAQVLNLFASLFGVSSSSSEVTSSANTEPMATDAHAPVVPSEVLQYVEKHGKEHMDDLDEGFEDLPEYVE